MVKHFQLVGIIIALSLTACSHTPITKEVTTPLVIKRKIPDELLQLPKSPKLITQEEYLLKTPAQREEYLTLTSYDLKVQLNTCTSQLILIKQLNEEINNVSEQKNQ